MDCEYSIVPAQTPENAERLSAYVEQEFAKLNSKNELKITTEASLGMPTTKAGSTNELNAH